MIGNRGLLAFEVQFEGERLPSREHSGHAAGRPRKSLAALARAEDTSLTALSYPDCPGRIRPNAHARERKLIVFTGCLSDVPLHSRRRDMRDMRDICPGCPNVL